jgi:elongation factor G
MAIPLIKGEKIEGIVDIVLRKAYAMEKGKCVEVALPDEMKSQVDEMYTVLAESVAETSEEFMDKYFSGETFSDEEMIQGIRSGIRTGSLVPVVCGSAFTGLGTELFLNICVNLLPSPAEGNREKAVDASGKSVEIEVSENGAAGLIIFKTIQTNTVSFLFQGCFRKDRVGYDPNESANRIQ